MGGGSSKSSVRPSLGAKEQELGKSPGSKSPPKSPQRTGSESKEEEPVQQHRFVANPSAPRRFSGGMIWSPPALSNRPPPPTSSSAGRSPAKLKKTAIRDASGWSVDDEHSFMVTVKKFSPEEAGRLVGRLETVALVENLTNENQRLQEELDAVQMHIMGGTAALIQRQTAEIEALKKTLAFASSLAPAKEDQTRGSATTEEGAASSLAELVAEGMTALECRNLGFSAAELYGRCAEFELNEEGSAGYDAGYGRLSILNADGEAVLTRTHFGTMKMASTSPDMMYSGPWARAKDGQDIRNNQQARLLRWATNQQ